MLAVISKHHNPEQIYQHFAKLGPLKVKIWKKFIILAYEDERIIEKAYKKYKSFDLQNKRVELRMLNEEGGIDEDYQRERSRDKILPIEMEAMEDQGVQKHVKIVNNYKQKIMGDLVNHMNKITKEVLKKVAQIEQNYPDLEPKNIELLALEDKIKSKFKNLQIDFANQLKNINSLVKNFSSTKTKIIEIDPTFQHKSFIPKNIDLNNISIDETLQFINLERNSIRKILALNQTEFVVTQKNQVRGQVKFYSYNDANPIKTINMDDFPYGIACAKDYLLVGDRRGKINILLLNQQKSIGTSFKKVHKQNQLIFDIKTFLVPGQQFHRVLSVGMDNYILINRVEEYQISNDLYDLQFSQIHKHHVDGNVTGIQLWSPFQYLYILNEKVTMHEVIQKTRQTFSMNSPVSKVKKFNQNIIAVEMVDGIIDFVDTRNQRTVQNYTNLGKSLKALEVSSEHSIFYGGQSIIGLIDDRKSGKSVWENKKTHQKKVYDITTLKNSLISGDDNGKIVCWSF